MPVKHKRGVNRPKPQRQQQQSQPSQHSSVNQQQLITQYIAPNDQHSIKLQISSAQAEIYFQYLRKKITHQANDPFSLPFLNLKFEQLESWKGATEQLNLESRIYGMRVDNCHDYTIKMLNFVIRNQSEQIGSIQQKPSSFLLPSSSSTIIPNTTDTNFSLSQINFHSNLQKAQKLITTIQQDKNLMNHSLWRVIFKKSQTLEKIQLNTLGLSCQLVLEIDGRRCGWRRVESVVIGDDECEQGRDILQQLLPQSIMQSLSFASQKLFIFKQINSTKNQITKQIQQILQYSQSCQIHHQSIQQPLYFGYRQVDFNGLYEEFDQFTKFQQHEKVNDQKICDFNLLLDQHCREEVFHHKGPELYEIPVQRLNIINQQNAGLFQQHDLVDDDASIQGDLYEPHKDILFHSTLKKGKVLNRRNDVKIFGKRRRNQRTLIDFDNPAIGISRKAVLRQRRQVKNNIQNDNLVPINYVVIYQSRNPFKRQRKITRTSNRMSFYENLHSYMLVDCSDHDNAKYRQSHHQNHSLQSQQVTILPINQSAEPSFNHQYNNVLQDQNTNIQRVYKNVSMKMVKNEIQKEISNVVDESAMNVTNKITRMSNYSNFSNISDVSVMDSYLEDEGSRIGLKFLKQKMVNYDPLDILMSMLHVAYENQVLLEPIYTSFGHSTMNNDTNTNLLDIIIQGQNIS